MEENNILAERMRIILAKNAVEWEEKKMMGGYCFMVDDKMAFGTYKGGMMARVDPEEVSELLERTGANQMIHGKRPMKGYIMVDLDGYEKDHDLAFWIKKCLEFNPKAKSSKKKKKDK